MAFKPQDVTGERRGKLVADSLVEKIAQGSRSIYIWKWACDCGGSINSSISAVRRGQVAHCGCGRKRMKRTEHGHAVHGAVSATYQSYQGAKSRCFNPRNRSFHAYGGRGITMCDRWRDSYISFVEDMGERPENTTLERINVDGNYDPGNCKWATWQEQVRNTRQVYRILEGSTLMTLKDFAKMKGVSYSALHQRVHVTGSAPHAAVEAMLRYPHARVRK